MGELGAAQREALEEKRREKARNLRYRKPVVRDLNLESIRCQLSDIQEACADVHWYCDSDDGYDTLLNALDGDSDEAFEFKTAFADLEYQAERMADDMDSVWLPECFDLFFAGIGAGAEGGGLLGFDEYEEDYFGLDGFSAEAAEREAGKQLMRLTKQELIDAAGACFRVAYAFVGLRSRFDDLKAAMDILRGQNTALLKQVRAIDEAYDAAAAGDFYEWYRESKDFDRLLAALPDRVWIE